jgi:hypothetical protein
LISLFIIRTFQAGLERFWPALFAPAFLVVVATLTAACLLATVTLSTGCLLAAVLAFAFASACFSAHVALSSRGLLATLLGATLILSSIVCHFCSSSGLRVDSKGLQFEICSPANIMRVNDAFFSNRFDYGFRAGAN